jgi:hypothetical protein
MEKTFTQSQVEEIAHQAIANHVANGGGGYVSNALDGVSQTASAVAEETSANAERFAAKRLYDNVEEIVNKFILSRLGFFQRIFTKDSTKQMATLVGTYAVIHAIKSGGFGLTKYRVNHKVLNMLSQECNARIMDSVLGGFDTNIAKAIFTAPEITEAAEGAL